MPDRKLVCISFQKVLPNGKLEHLLRFCPEAMLQQTLMAFEAWRSVYRSRLEAAQTGAHDALGRFDEDWGSMRITVIDDQQPKPACDTGDGKRPEKRRRKKTKRESTSAPEIQATPLPVSGQHGMPRKPIQTGLFSWKVPPDEPCSSIAPKVDDEDDTGEF